MKSSPTSLASPTHWLQQSELLLSGGLLAVLIVMLIPLPTMLLDMLIASNLALTILLMLVTLNARQALDLSVFPSLLLLLTLYRLSLNIATTRLIMLDADAGKIVSTFGGRVVGGNLIVGLVIFLILVVIQFIVITKGAGRISEVAARFTLDAMPGKQMAIDAELNAGVLNEAEARRRRKELSREAEFYGAMDGAGKFVRGDAIAGLIITGVNLVGGIVMGLTNGMSLVDSLHTYSVLAVGDGLVSQIPALIIAVTAGILTTKTNSDDSLGTEIGHQLFASPSALAAGAGVLGLMALVPGLPKLPFLALAGGITWYLRRANKKPAAPAADAEETPAPAAPTEDAQLEDFLLSDRVGLEIGAQLIPHLHSKRTKGIADRIGTLRRDFARTNGLWIPPVRIRDNIQLEPGSYRILISGREVARGELRVDSLLAVNPGGASLPLEGESTRDPAFDLPAVWISQDGRRRAEIGGYTVVDALSVLTTHLGEVLRKHAHELLTREDLKKMLDKVRTFAPTIVDELKPDVIRMGALHQVLVQLVSERVSIADLATILESVINHAATVKDPDEVTSRVREDLGRTICDRFRDAGGKLRVLILDPRLEMQLRESMREKHLMLGPGPLEKLLTHLSRHWQAAVRQRMEIALLTDRALRRPLRQAILRALPELGVVSYGEVPGDVMIEPVEMLRVEDVFEPGELVRSISTAAPVGEPRTAQTTAA
ncbi:MAG: FHIPEP family type III secretion protein [Planctomycetaceae bacterium]|nr:FHIPEP family type III secretion protein [Planctomycetaceae bacterium]